MKTMTKKMKSPELFDMRGLLLKKGDVVLVRRPFPRSTTLAFGKVVALRVGKTGLVEVKLQDKNWYKNPIKLATK